MHGTGVAGREPISGVDAVGSADAVLVPALAVAADGTRLGRGGGSYDRALARAAGVAGGRAALCRRGASSDLPRDPWDRPVTAVVTPAGWLDLSGRQPPSGRGIPGLAPWLAVTARRVPTTARQLAARRTAPACPPISTRARTRVRQPVRAGAVVHRPGRVDVPGLRRPGAQGVLRGRRGLQGLRLLPQRQPRGGRRRQAASIVGLARRGVFLACVLRFEVFRFQVVGLVVEHRRPRRTGGNSSSGSSERRSRRPADLHRRLVVHTSVRIHTRRLEPGRRIASAAYGSADAPTTSSSADPLQRLAAPCWSRWRCLLARRTQRCSTSPAAKPTSARRERRRARRGHGPRTRHHARRPRDVRVARWPRGLAPAHALTTARSAVGRRLQHAARRGEPVTLTRVVGTRTHRGARLRSGRETVDDSDRCQCARASRRSRRPARPRLQTDRRVGAERPRPAIVIARDVQVLAVLPHSSTRTAATGTHLIVATSRQPHSCSPRSVGSGSSP